MPRSLYGLYPDNAFLSRELLLLWKVSFTCVDEFFEKFSCKEIMGKNAEKKLKKVHLETEKEIVEAQPVEEKVNKPNFGKELKQSLIRENSYISEVLGIVNFPKRDDSDDEGN